MSEKPAPSDAKSQEIEIPPVTVPLVTQFEDPPKTDWDPTRRAFEIPSPQCLQRVKRDMLMMYSDPPPGIYAVPDSQNMTTIHALITGPFDTPYEGGLFYFLLSCPPDYPIRPPLARFMTTDGGMVRFNPNLYKNGKICLSILGTWSGPTWSPAQSLSSVLISIQSILNENPYHNEPSYETEKTPGDVARYNEIIRHETLRVGVCGMLENEASLKIPRALIDVMEKTFLEYFDSYIATCTKKVHMDGQRMQDPFFDERGTFEYKKIMHRLGQLFVTISAKHASSGEKDKLSDECSEISDSDELEPGEIRD